MAGYYLPFCSINACRKNFKFQSMFGEEKIMRKFLMVLCAASLLFFISC